MDCKYIKADTVLPYSSALDGELKVLNLNFVHIASNFVQTNTNMF